jgi:rod shape-determining protein MreD
MRTFLPDLLISAVLLLFQSTIARFLAIETLTPDLLLLWIIIIAVRRGQLAATIAGFVLGLLMDLAGAGDRMVGLMALTKTVSGFLAGYFYNENKIQQILGGYEFLLIAGLVGVVHHLLYFLIFLQGSGIGVGAMFFQYGVPATLYTTAIGLLPMFFFGRKHRV